jgi:hypothetical protein
MGQQFAEQFCSPRLAEVVGDEVLGESVGRQRRQGATGPYGLSGVRLGAGGVEAVVGGQQPAGGGVSVGEMGAAQPGPGLG